MLDRLPELSRIIYLEPRGIQRRYTHEKLLDWEAFLDLGRQHREEHPLAIAEALAAQHPADLATLIYTSGTTGPPKGAMLTVANVEFAIQVLCEEGAFTDPPPNASDLTLSYLPLSHVAERIFTTWFNAAAATQVNFAESIETVPQNLREVQPTVLFGVPGSGRNCSRAWRSGCPGRPGSNGARRRSGSGRRPIGDGWSRPAACTRSAPG